MCQGNARALVGGIAGAFVGGPMGAMAGAAIGASTVRPPTPQVPALAPTPVMPTMNSAGVAQARRLSIAQQLAQGGRSSTILSQPSGSQVLGG